MGGPVELTFELTYILVHFQNVRPRAAIIGHTIINHKKAPCIMQGAFSMMNTVDINNKRYQFCK